MLKILKNKKFLMVVALVGLVVGAYMLGKQSASLSGDYVNAEWSKLTPETQLMIKEATIKVRDALKADVCK